MLELIFEPEAQAPRCLVVDLQQTMIHLFVPFVNQILNVVYQEDPVRFLADLHIIDVAQNVFVNGLGHLWQQFIFAVELQTLQGLALGATLAAYEYVLALIEYFEAVDLVRECVDATA